METIRQFLVTLMVAVVAFLKPIEGELSSLFLIFFLNFFFGYLTGSIANKEKFDFKKAFRCIGEATVFFILCLAVFLLGRFKDQQAGALQCVSFITYVIIYLYSTNILRNLKKLFKKDTTPWLVVSFLYYVLRFKFVERIPYLSEYLNINKEVSNESRTKESV